MQQIMVSSNRWKPHNTKCSHSVDESFYFAWQLFHKRLLLPLNDSNNAFIVCFACHSSLLPATVIPKGNFSISHTMFKWKLFTPATWELIILSFFTSSFSCSWLLSSHVVNLFHWISIKTTSHLRSPTLHLGSFFLIVQVCDRLEGIDSSVFSSFIMFIKHFAVIIAYNGITSVWNGSRDG